MLLRFNNFLEWLCVCVCVDSET